MEAPTFGSLYYDKVFILYPFPFDTSYISILAQNNEEGNEVPISFMSLNLQGGKIKYPDVEKQGFVVFKEVKHFRTYMLKA